MTVSVKTLKTLPSYASFEETSLALAAFLVLVCLMGVDFLMAGVGLVEAEVVGRVFFAEAAMKLR